MENVVRRIYREVTPWKIHASSAAGTLRTASAWDARTPRRSVPVRKNVRRNRTLILALLLFSFLCAVCPAIAAPPDLDKAIRIGSGRTMVIEYTDPDCPFCRKGAAFFRERQDVTLYVFLTPLAIHPQAKEKAEYILSASDKARAYEDVMSGKMDGKPLTGITDGGKRLLEEHRAFAKEAKVDSTPTFFICGRIIEGFDLRRMEEALGK